MRTLATFVLLGFVVVLIGCMGNESDSSDSNSDSQSDNSNADGTTAVVDQVVEASCGQCQFDMEGTGCDLAVRIDGKTYYVDGSSIDDHGDAHGEDGMCNCIREAKISGEIKDGRFVATSFEVQPK